MKRHLLARLLVLSVLLSMSGGCGSVISKEMRQRARKDLSLPKVMERPGAYVGKHVIWGGIIVENRQESDGTVILVLETPLDRFQMPKNDSEARGRFMAKTEYLNPTVYRPDAKVTLAGEIVGQEVGSSAGIVHPYPLVWIEEIHLWSGTVPHYSIPVPPPPEIWSPAETWGHGR